MIGLGPRSAAVNGLACKSSGIAAEGAPDFAVALDFAFGTDCLSVTILWKSSSHFGSKPKDSESCFTSSSVSSGSLFSSLHCFAIMESEYSPVGNCVGRISCWWRTSNLPNSSLYNFTCRFAKSTSGLCRVTHQSIRRRPSSERLDVAVAFMSASHASMH